jgi:hypothetical protein
VAHAAHTTLKSDSAIKIRRLVARCADIAAVTVLVVASAAAFAQGGPPLVTDDPETPGDGHWEINLAAIASHRSGRWEVAAPDADINYGWGEHVQLKLDVPWIFVHETDEGWKSGLGPANVGVKWRFVDIEDSGFSMSVYPQYAWNWSSSAPRRGISAPGRQIFLPIEAATVVGEFALDGEVGRNLVQYGQNQWEAGFVAAHSCGGESVECLGEVHQTWGTHNSQTLLNIGVHWKLNESVVLLAAAGREFGTRSDDQQKLLVYFGFQLLR